MLKHCGSQTHQQAHFARRRLTESQKPVDGRKSSVRPQVPFLGPERNDKSVILCSDGACLNSCVSTSVHRSISVCSFVCDCVSPHLLPCARVRSVWSDTQRSPLPRVEEPFSPLKVFPKVEDIFVKPFIFSVSILWWERWPERLEAPQNQPWFVLIYRSSK